MVLRQKYMEAVKADRFEELKKSLFQIIMHPEYDKFINVFKIDNEGDFADIEKSILNALSKGMFLFIKIQRFYDYLKLKLKSMQVEISLNSLNFQLNGTD